MTTVGVAMITCNGSAFLAEQLDSITGQSSPPDEIVIVDDASTDDTVDLAERLTREFDGAARVLRNPDRLGVVGNITRALREMTTDIIALADQDDVWEADKLAVLRARFEQEPAIDAIFTDAHLIDADGTLTGGRLWQSVGFGAAEQSRWQADPLALLLIREVVTGATLAIRRSVLAQALPIPEVPGGLHDSWMALLLADPGRIGVEARPLIRYRQHAANVAGLHAGGLRDRLSRGRQALVDAPARAAFLRLAADRMDDPARAARTTDAADHLAARGDLHGRLSRLGTIAGEITSGRYRRYSGGWRTAVWDAVVPRPGSAT